MNPRTHLAIQIFQPTEDAPMGNCAEAILRAFAGTEDPLPDGVKNLRRLAKGKAPGGLCGAYFAGRHILSRENPDLLAAFERSFQLRTGCTTCRMIRRRGSSSCRGCVLATAEFLETAFPQDE